MNQYAMMKYQDRCRRDCHSLDTMICGLVPSHSFAQEKSEGRTAICIDRHNYNCYSTHTINDNREA